MDIDYFKADLETRLARAEREKRLGDVAPLVIPDAETAKLIQPGKRPLHDPKEKSPDLLIFCRKRRMITESRGLLWLQLGGCQRESGLFTEAEQSFQQVLQLDPENLEARTALANRGRAGRE